VADDEALLAGRWPPVVAIDDLQVCTADPDRLRPDQDRPVVQRWLGHVGERGRALLARHDGNRAHNPKVTGEKIDHSERTRPTPDADVTPADGRAR
jgi:hypothetical protein